MLYIIENELYMDSFFSATLIEINTTFYEDAEIKMKRWLLQTKFMHCQRLLQRHIQRISEKFGRLRSSAASVVERGGIAPTISQLNHPCE